jgi:phosphoribosylformylglycinamidine synthase I
VTTAYEKFRYKRFFFAFLIWAIVILITTLLEYFIYPNQYEISINPLGFIISILLMVVLMPLQSGFEEIFFRGYLMGICNGFQVLVEAHLLPGVLLRNSSQKFISKNIYLKAAMNNSLLTQELDTNKAYKIPIAHAEGRYFTDEKTLASLKANDQILFYYCNENGEVTEESNPNGSLLNIAGICNEGRNVFGMMPHPERAADPDLNNTDGLEIMKQLILQTV